MCNMIDKRIIVALTIGFILMAISGSWAQQIKRTVNAVITAQTMDYDWGTGQAEFTGNVKLVLTGAYNATMTAPRMSVKLSPKAERVLSVVAQGPAHFSVVTAPDAQGLRRKIEATAQQQLTYAAETQIVTLIGGATADVLPVSEGENADVEAVHFTGQTIVANLKTNKLTVQEANLSVEAKTE